MTKIKTYDLMRLRQIDREKFEEIIKKYADYFCSLTDEERKGLFKKDPNAELIREFISKLFGLTIKFTEEDVLRRWFDSAKSQNFFEDIECAQGIGNDKMIDCLLNLPFEKKIEIINEAEYYGDLDIAEKLLDIEGRTKKAESALASFREEINERLDEIDKDIAEKLRVLRETTVAIEDRTKKAEPTLELFRGEVNGRLDKIDSEIKEFTQESQQTFIAISATQYRNAIKSAPEEKDLIESLGDAMVKAAIKGISEAFEEGVKDISKIPFEQIKNYLLRIPDEELVKLSREKFKSPEDFAEVPEE